jgi:hypothetical protein
MANPFDAMVARMDAATVNLMADKVTINGVSFDAVESQFVAEMGPVVGMACHWWCSPWQCRRAKAMPFTGRARTTSLPANSCSTVSHRSGLSNGGSMSIKGLEQAIANLESISKTVPRASSQAVNRVATRAISRSTRQVAKDTRVQRNSSISVRA